MANNQINGYLASVGGVVGSLSGSAKRNEQVRITQQGDVRVTQDGSCLMAVTIEAVLSLEGLLQEESRIEGILHEPETLHGELQSTLDLSGSLTVPPIRGGVPYTGDYEITPTEETQVLQTHGRILTKNITINPIPTDYGKVTWTSGHIRIT